MKADKTLGWGLGAKDGVLTKLTPEQIARLTQNGICTRCRGLSYAPDPTTPRHHLMPTYGYHDSKQCPWGIRSSEIAKQQDHQQFKRTHPGYCPP